ncbi:hypothetical protein WAI453_011553 [Rhynchosporium graminicola]
MDSNWEIQQGNFHLLESELRGGLDLSNLPMVPDEEINWSEWMDMDMDAINALDAGYETKTEGHWATLRFCSASLDQPIRRVGVQQLLLTGEEILSPTDQVSPAGNGLHDKLLNINAPGKKSSDAFRALSPFSPLPGRRDAMKATKPPKRRIRCPRPGFVRCLLCL